MLPSLYPVFSEIHLQFSPCDDEARCSYLRSVAGDHAPRIDALQGVMSARRDSLWPPHAGRGRRDGQHLAGTRLRDLRGLLHATPFGRYHEQRFPICAPEHASEPTAVKRDRLQHLTTFANAHAMFVGDVRVPDGLFAIEANTVGKVAVKVGPQPPVREAAVSRA